MVRRQTLISPPASSHAVAAVMRGNKKRNSRPELVVRKLLHALGYRYRLHARDLPGNPDIVFLKRKQVVFVHGCFWHQHPDENCTLRSHPKSNLHYWAPKLRRNRERDRENERKIADIGWNALVIWECELDDIPSLQKRLIIFLSKRRIGATTSSVSRND
jgi:DNA mismatch endonuclease (patch repair protein)